MAQPDSDSLERRIVRARSRLTSSSFVTGALLFLAALMALWLVASALESKYWFPSSTRTLILVGVIALAGVVLAIKVAVPILRHFGLLGGLSDEEIARMVGRRYPRVGDKLLAYVQLRNGHHSKSDDILIGNAATMLNGELARVGEFEKIEDPKKVKAAAGWFILALIPLLLAFSTSRTQLSSASNRLLTPLVDYTKPSLYSFDVQPGDITIVKGTDLEIAGQIVGRSLPPSAIVSLRYPGEIVTEDVVVSVDSAAFSHTVEVVRNPFEYRISVDQTSSRWYSVDVVEQPFVKSLQVSVTPPRYTRLPQRHLSPNVGDVAALPGSQVDIVVVPGGSDVSSAEIDFEKVDPMSLTISETGIEGRFFVRREQNYHIRLNSVDDVPNADPVPYSITMLTDQHPLLEILSPQPLYTLSEELHVPVEARISDDYGFRRLSIHYRISKSRLDEPDSVFRSIDIPIGDLRTLDQEIPFDWDLAQSISPPPIPGDEIEYFLRVYDNDSVSGPKFAQSENRLLKFPSLAERYDQLDESKENTLESLSEVIEESRELRDEFDELKEDIQRDPESSVDKQAKIEQLTERQKALEAKVDEVASSLEEAIQQMEENDLTSDETLDMFKELQKVVEEINSPELMETLEDLQQAMDEMNLKDIQEALDKFDFDEDQFQQRLGRTMELFKNIRAQQELEEIAERAGELEQQEKELEEHTKELAESDEADKSAESEKLAEQQEQAKADMAELEEMLRKAQEHIDELNAGPKQEMQEMMDEVESAEMQQQMQQNAEELRDQNFESAQEGQQQMQQQLKKMQQSAMQMQTGMQSAQQQINMAGLRQALNDALLLSHSQEALRDAVAGLSAGGPQLREYARDQVNIASGLGTIADSLRKLSEKIPQMTRQIQTHTGEALREMSSATQAMTDRVAQRAVSHQTASLTEINELAVLLADLLNQLQNNSSGGGGQSLSEMIQQLQQMSQQQQQMNDEVQQMLNEMRGRRLTPNMEQRLQQIADQQDQMRRQLREMNRNSEARGKLLGDLNKIAQQMEESIREMQKKQLGRRTVYRQQQILTRLLQATRSMEERGKRKERESEEGETIDRTSPESQMPSDLENKIRRELIRALESGYSVDYQELIKKYFDLLQSKQVQN